MEKTNAHFVECVIAATATAEGMSVAKNAVMCASKL